MAAATTKVARIHLAKRPSSAVLTSWCGVSERRARKKDGDTLYCTDENPIVRGAGWTCIVCEERMRAESSRILGILGARSAELEALRDAAFAMCCGNHGCICAPVRGLGTNGACHCLQDLRHIRSAMTAWRRYAMALEGQPPTAPGDQPVASDSPQRDDGEEALRAFFKSTAWPKTRGMMRHALGLDNTTGSKRAYRNYYSVTEHGETLAQWRALVDVGLAVCDSMVRRHDAVQVYFFHLTEKGINLVTDFSEREKEGP